MSTRLMKGPLYIPETPLKKSINHYAGSFIAIPYLGTSEVSYDVYLCEEPASLLLKKSLSKSFDAWLELYSFDPVSISKWNRSDIRVSWLEGCLREANPIVQGAYLVWKELEKKYFEKKELEVEVVDLVFATGE